MKIENMARIQEEYKKRKGFWIMKLNKFVTVLLVGTALTGCASNSKTSSDINAGQNSADARVISSRNGDNDSEAVSLAKAHALRRREDKQNGILQNGIVGSAEISSPDNHHSKVYYLYGAEQLNLDDYYFDIPVVYNDAVKKWISYFLNRGRGFFERYSARAGRYAPLLGKILEDNGLPRDLIFLAMAESGFQNNAKSWAKAVGPWQFMPYTGKVYGLKIDWYIDERRDPIKATGAASRYLTKLYGDFGAWELASAAYNAGEGKMSRAIGKYKTENFWNLTKGRYLKPETKDYVPKIMALAIIGKNLRAFGFEDIDFYEPLDFDEIEVPGMTDLMTLATNLEVDFEEIQRLNPEVSRWFTPPGPKYKLRVPIGYKEHYEECCQNMTLAASAFQKYLIPKNGLSISQIAKKFKVHSYAMEDINKGINIEQGLKKGDSVFLPFREGQSIRDNMYADLYDKPRRQPRWKKFYRSRTKLANSRHKKVSEVFVGQKGAAVSRSKKKAGVPVSTVIKPKTSTRR